MRTNITLEQALEKASKPLQEKILYSVNLLRKAEHIAKYYGGVKTAIILPLVRAKTVKPYTILLS